MASDAKTTLPRWAWALIGAGAVLALLYMLVEGWWEQAFTRLL